MEPDSKPTGPSPLRPQIISEEPAGPPPPAPPPGTGRIRRRLAALRGGRLVIALLLIAGFALGLALYLAAKPSTQQPASSTGLQDVSADELKKFSNSFLTPTTTQTVTINSNAQFNNAVNVDKTLTAGAISTKNFSVTGAVSLDSVDVKNNASVGGAALLQGNVEARGQLTVRGALAAASASFNGNVSVTGNLAAGSLAVGSLTTSSLTVTGDLSVGGHLALSGAAVAAAAGAASGGGSVSVSGNDSAGTVTINTGGSPGAGQLATVTFSKPFPAAPRVLLTPANKNAGTLQWYNIRSASFFAIETASAAAAGQQYVFDYFILQ